jgi:hypothetical protein
MLRCSAATATGTTKTMEAQLILFIAMTGMIGHAVLMAANGRGFTASEPREEDGEDELWSSERFQQSAKGEKRPFWIE